ncbi:MAG: chromosomal replication initiator protein DnaA [Eggerthellaceae bacterium]|jgi:chromosomal replication initiator protein|nr:chromosomal replication initiator protein DnaA [Eggerthellaceae bacterium]
MDAEKLNSSWKDICNHIKSYNHIDSTQINAFFSRLHPQAMSDGFLMLTADNDFIKTWIERHYIEFIKQALLDLYQTPYTVSIEVDAAAAPALTGEEEAESLSPSNGGSGPEGTGTEAQTNTAAVATAGTENPPSHPTRSMSPNTPRNAPDTIGDMSRSASSDILHPTPSLTFENFVIGESNRMAYSMAVAVAETPGKSHLNPLFIHGKSGLGKTHLLCAIQNYLHETLPELVTVYIDSAEFLSDYMEATVAHDKEKSSYKRFKNRYEEADVLLIDDVQYLQGKKQTLEIVFQIFNKLTRLGKQVVLSADRAPKNIDMDQRYTTRFNSGSTFDIQPPEIETKLGIVKNFIEEYKESEQKPYFNISEDVQIYIAENSSSNIRELKSAVTKVIYQMTFSDQQKISLDDVRRLLENHFSGGPSKKLTVEDIQKEVEGYYKVSHADLVGKKRVRNIIYARQIGIYLCRHMLDIPFNDIGKKFNRDHSTVMYSVANVEEKLKESRELREEIENLRQIIRDS